MNTIRVACAGAIVLALLAVPRVNANAQWALGVSGGYDADMEEFLVGANARIQLPKARINGVPLVLSPGFEFYPFFDPTPGSPATGGSVFIASFDGHYTIQTQGAEPYFGAGLHVRRVSVELGSPFGTVGDTDTGLNLVGGAVFGRSRSVRPFGEAGLRLGDGATFLIKGGVYFRIGR